MDEVANAKGDAQDAGGEAIPQESADYAAPLIVASHGQAETSANYAVDQAAVVPLETIAIGGCVVSDEQGPNRIRSARRVVGTSIWSCTAPVYEMFSLTCLQKKRKKSRRWEYVEAIINGRSACKLKSRTSPGVLIADVTSETCPVSLKRRKYRLQILTGVIPGRSKPLVIGKGDVLKSRLNCDTT